VILHITEVVKKGEVFRVITDEPFPSKIYIGSHGYAVVWVDGKKQLLHRYLTGAKKGQRVDHKNENKLDNRRENLRIANASQNSANSSKRKGFHFDKQMKKFRSQIMVNGKNIFIGLFDTKEEARKAYEQEHAKQFGEFSPYYKGAENNE
jgi:HNH endonuclease